MIFHLVNFPVKRKQLIKELHHFDMATAYDEFLLFKGFSAFAQTM